VQQYRHFLRMLREVKEANAEMGIEGCNSGGEWCDWDKYELLERNQSSDGGGPDDLYYLSYFWPIAKMIGSGIGYEEPTDQVVEQLTENILFQRYLVQEGVVGRHMRVCHPRAKGSPDEHTFLQFASLDRLRAVIRQDTDSVDGVIVYPKNLVPNADYSVRWLLGDASYHATGKALMCDGIRHPASPRRQQILLNLDHYPGSGWDTVSPTSPTLTRQERAVYWDHTGVALRWTESSDNHLLAGYRVLRDGEFVDYVGIGTFYFDERSDADASARYQIVAVDADGNESAPSNPI